LELGSHPQNLDITACSELFKAILGIERPPHGKVTFAEGNDQALGAWVGVSLGEEFRVWGVTFK